MKSRIIIAVLLCLGSAIHLPAQRPWMEYMQDSIVNYSEVVARFEKEWEGKTAEKGMGYKQFRRWEYLQGLRVLPDGTLPPAGYEAAEMARWESQQANQKRSSLVPNGNWTHLGPVALPTNTVGQPGGIGRTTTVAFHPTDPNRLYCGTPAGGLWTSTNMGATWSTSTDFLATLGVSAIVLNPSNPNIIYIGTGDKDAGDASGLGTYKSTDGGATFAVSNTGMGNRTVHCMVMDPNDNNKILAATSNGIYRSINAGANWTQVLASGTTYQIEYRRGSNSTLYAINNARLYTSTDDGATWNTGVVISTTARAAFATTPANADVIYVVKDIGANPVFKSTDGGLTFTNVQTDAKVLLNGSCAGTGTGGQGWYDICIAVEPSGTNTVMVGGVSLWKSTDGGVNFSIAGCWSSMATNIHADHHWLAFSPHFASRLFICNDGGLYYTDAMGAPYANISSGIAVSQIYRAAASATNPSIIITGLQDNGMLPSRTPNWWITVGGDGTECAIDPTDPNYQYGSYVNGVIRRSTGAGFGWSTIANSTGTGGITEAGPWITPYVLQPGNPNVMLAGYVSIWRSTNVKAGTPSFTVVQPFGSGSIRDLHFGDANTAYCSRSNGEFWQSMDGGVTWSMRTNPPGGAARDIAADPAAPQNVWVASGNDVYHSDDGGGSWTLWDTGLPNISVQTVVYDRVAQAVYCGMWVGVYYRGVADASWVPFSTGLPNTQALHLQIHYDPNGCLGKDKLRLATYGRGYWESDLYAPPTLVPVACFGADTTRACLGSGTIQLYDSSAYDPTSWLWNITGPGSVTFVGGTSATTQHPQVTFGAVGLYTVTLTVSNANGNDMTSKVSYLEVVLPPVNFSTADTLIYVGQTASFTDASANCVTSWLWDFGDGFTSTLENPTHIYATAGLYTVTLTVDGGVNTLVKTNYVQVLPHLTVPYTSSTAGWTGDMESDATAWHFGDLRITNNNKWERGSVALTFPAAASGTKCWATDLDAAVPVSTYSCGVLSPTFDMSAPGTYQVRLKTAMESVYCNAPLGATVEYTTNLGATWTRLGAKQGTDPAAFANWYNKGATGGCDNADVVTGQIGWNYAGLTFRQAIYDASALAGNARVGFRVRFWSSAAYGAFTSKGFAFDDFELDFAPAMAAPDTIPGSLVAFDGVNDYVETFYGGNHNPFTLECWVMSPAAPSGAARTSIAQKSNVLEFNWNHPTAASRGAVAMRNSAGTWQNFSFGPLVANTWYHLAVTFDGTTVRTYKNGLLVTSAAFTGSLTVNANNWQLGLGAANFNGQVDEFRMWSVARSLTEIREAMHRTLDEAELGNVAIYFQSNEPSGYLKEVTHLRNGYLQNGLGRALSPIAVGKGLSQSLSITGTGSFNFATCGLQLDYTAAAATPFDVTVTRIHQFINQQTPNPAWNAAPNISLTDTNGRFYHVINAFGGGAFSANVTVRNIPDLPVGYGSDPASVKLVKRPSNSVLAWEAGIPAASVTPSTGPAYDGVATFNGITSFSQAFIGMEPGVLPVSLQLFGITADGGANHLLFWNSPENFGLARYQLQRSTSSTNGFVTIAERDLAPGDHQITDPAMGQTTFYRLLAQLPDGSWVTSNVVELSPGGQNQGIRVFPNPASDRVWVEVSQPESGNVTYQLADMAGKILLQGVWEDPAPVHCLEIEGLANGVYSMTMIQGSKPSVFKVMVVH
jgi:PKD repeat protein